MKVLPDPGPERTRTLLLLAVLAVLVAWVWWPDGTGQPPAAPIAGGTTAATPGTTGVPTAAPAEPLLPQPVQLAALGATPGPVDVGRNLFRFGSRPAPPPPPPLPSEAAAPPPPPRPTGPPPVPLRLTGLFQAPDGHMVATLRDSGTGALFHATEGDTVDGRYRLVKVGAQSAIVSYVDGSGQRTIALGGG